MRVAQVLNPQSLSLAATLLRLTGCRTSAAIGFSLTVVKVVLGAVVH